MHYEMWSEITCPFLTFDYAGVQVWESISNFPTLNSACAYLSMPGLKLTYIDKKGNIGTNVTSIVMDTIHRHEL